LYGIHYTSRNEVVGGDDLYDETIVIPWNLKKLHVCIPENHIPIPENVNW
jgi:hypothetical protein